ncbi:hypothetical protein [Calothrix sp. CCY 0018]|uniref:hypothetical protein n=1 Tax=Calothrix sp. CCY 0018 TaxID=3103864 RepID=UPI0039C74F7C
MSSPAITTVLKMIESLPENAQNQVVEHLREYIQNLEEELKWEQSLDISTKEKELHPNLSPTGGEA